MKKKLMDNPSSQLREDIGRRIMDSVRHIAEAIDHVLFINKIPITSGQLPLLMLSFKFEGYSKKELAGILKRDNAGVFRGLRSLEKRGLVRFRRDDSDKRKRLVYLTPKAHRIRASIHEQKKRNEKQLIAGLSAKEINSLYAFLDIIDSNCRKIIDKKDSGSQDYRINNGLQKAMRKNRS